MDNFEAENIKLKDILENKIFENDQLSTKILKQKTHYEDSITILRK